MRVSFRFFIFLVTHCISSSKKNEKPKTENLLVKRKPRKKRPKPLRYRVLGGGRGPWLALQGLVYLMELEGHGIEIAEDIGGRRLPDATDGPGIQQ